jgi:16S rRNA processing protein RimM
METQNVLTKNNATNETSMVLVGKIQNAYAISGWVKVYSFSSEANALNHAKKWWISNTDNEHSPKTIVTRKNIKPNSHPQEWLVQLAEVTDRNQAELLKNHYIWIDRKDFPQTQKDEFYWLDLINYQVVNLEGVMLGILSRWEENTMQSVMVITGGKYEHLVPFVKHFVEKVDKETQTITIDWQEDFSDEM